VEINLGALEQLADKRHRPRQYVEEYHLPSGRTIRVLAEGRLINLAAAEGHPAAVMDMSFANQGLCVDFICNSKEPLENTVYTVPGEIDREIARLKLEAMKINIDSLTEDQQEYLSSWQEGT
jgi:adenosylhomocysteinase